MKVLLTSTSYPSSLKDWRGRFIADMVASLARLEEMELDVWAPPGQLPPRVGDASSGEESAWLDSLASRGGIAHLLKTRGPFALGTVFGLLSRLRQVYRRSDADVFHVNWMQNALAISNTSQPALVTVLGSDLGLLRLPGMKYQLLRVFSRRKVILAPNAGWMAASLNEQFGEVADIRPVPFGVDRQWFEVQRKSQVSKTRKWLAVTRLTQDKLGPLFLWGEGIFQGDDELHLFGPRQEQGITIPDWVHYHGPTHPQELRDEWFPEAAGLVTLSRHSEGRPQVVLEAMAAGLPVVASILPAHADVIIPGSTGMLVDSQESLAMALGSLSDTASNCTMGLEAQSWVKKNVGTWEDAAQRYLACYHSLLGESD